MEAQDFKPGGIVVFWSAKEADRVRLEQGLTDIGLEKFLPEQRTAFAVLKDALSVAFQDRDVLVRALANREGLTVVEESKGLSKNEYAHLFSALINEKTEIIHFTEDNPRIPAVQEQYQKHRHILHPSSVTNMLVEITDHFGGTALRPGGSIYWLSEVNLGKWKRVTEQVEAASPGTRVYMLRVGYDEDMTKAVTDAIAAEILAETKIIEEEIVSGDIGKRAVESRQKTSNALREKVKTYESILAATLPRLHDALDRVNNVAVKALIQESVLVEEGSV